MSLNEPEAVPIPSNRPRRFDTAVDRYATWREKSAAVTAAYEDWARAPRAKRLSAYAAYVTTLDAEERAASAYQRFVEQAAP